MIDPLAFGFDPYDALCGTRVPGWMRQRARTRQLVIQLRKRSPLNLAPVLGITAFRMAKALGCFLAAESRLVLLGRSDAHALESIDDALRGTGGNVGDGAWGYEFDVQTRWSYYPAGSPNAIATVFVGRGYLEAALVTGRDSYLDEARRSARFCTEVLLRPHATGPAFFYTPGTSRLIHNANLLAAGFVAAVGRVTGEKTQVEIALETARTSVGSQRADGTWPYGEGVDLRWVDNFHTAYDLDGIAWVAAASGNTGLVGAIRAGYDAWSDGFFSEAGEAYHDAGCRGARDIHSAATAVDVAARLAVLVEAAPELARRVYERASTTLVDAQTGRTYYRVGRLGTDRRHFQRWGDAHWAMASASVALLEAGILPPVEAALAERVVGV